MTMLMTVFGRDKKPALTATIEEHGQVRSILLRAYYEHGISDADYVVEQVAIKSALQPQQGGKTDAQTLDHASGCH